MIAVDVALTAFALLGHAALWIGLANRIHATGAPRWLVKLGSGICHFLLISAPLTALGYAFMVDGAPDGLLGATVANPWLWVYLIPCWVLAAVSLVLWLLREILAKPAAAVLANQTRVVEIGARVKEPLLAGFRAKLLSHVPGNQVLQLAIQEKHLQVDRLPARLDGLSIAHLADLHFTGRVGIGYFQEVIRQTNELRADLVVLAGDLVDKVEYFDWIPKLWPS